MVLYVYSHHFCEGMCMGTQGNAGGVQLGFGRMHLHETVAHEQFMELMAWRYHAGMRIRK